MKKVILIILIAVAAVFAFGYFRSASSPAGSDTATVSSSDPVIFFYGRECPHCQVVEEFLTQNNVAQKVKFSQAEIFHNKGNQAIFVEKEKACGVTKEEDMGVPMLWADGRCLVGQEEVIKYFQDKIGSSGQGTVSSEQK